MYSRIYSHIYSLICVFIYICTHINVHSFTYPIILTARRPYDLFTVSERESEDDNKVFKEILKVIRGSLYFVFVAIILAGTVSSRISLFLLASDISQVLIFVVNVNYLCL